MRISREDGNDAVCLEGLHKVCASREMHARVFVVVVVVVQVDEKRRLSGEERCIWHLGGGLAVYLSQDNP